MTDDNKDKTAGVVAGGLASVGGVYSLPCRGLKTFGLNTLKMETTKKQRQDVRTIVHLFSELKERKLSESQELFIKCTKKYFRQNGLLTEKQIDVLLDIREYSEKI